MDTVVCDNCAKEIPTQSYQLHHIHCLRNIVRCHCGATLSKSDKEAHDKEMHIPKPCPNCKELIEPMVFQYHDCPKKPKVCRFCEAYIPQDSFNRHIYECGSRTEMCYKCNKYIPLRDYDHHIAEVDCTAQPLSRQDANRARFLSDPYGMSPADEAEIQRPRAAFVSHARGPHRPENLQPPRPRAASELDLDPERIISNRREELNQLLQEMRSKGLADLDEHATFEHISEFDSEHEIGSERTLSTIPQEIPTPVEFGDASRGYGRPNYDDQLQRAIQASLEESEVQQDVHDMDSMTEEERMLNEAILKSLQEH